MTVYTSFITTVSRTFMGLQNTAISWLNGNISTSILQTNIFCLTYLPKRVAVSATICLFYTTILQTSVLQTSTSYTYIDIIFLSKTRRSES